MIHKVLYKIAHEAEWTVDLSRYNFGDGVSRPALFNADSIDEYPVDVDPPYAILYESASGNAPIASGAFASRNTREYDFFFTLMLTDGKRAGIRESRERAYRAFSFFCDNDTEFGFKYCFNNESADDRNHFTICLVECTIPQAVLDDMSFPAHAFSIDIMATKER